MSMGRAFYGLSSLWFTGLGMYFVANNASEVQSGILFVLGWICFSTSSIIKAIEGK